MTEPHQSWVAKCRWKGRKEFYVGTFWTPVRDGIEAARREAEQEAVKFFEDILPVKVNPPDSIFLKPGIIVLQLEEERQAA